MPTASLHVIILRLRLPKIALFRVEEDARLVDLGKKKRKSQKEIQSAFPGETRATW